MIVAAKLRQRTFDPNAAAGRSGYDFRLARFAATAQTNAPMPRVVRTAWARLQS